MLFKLLTAAIKARFSTSLGPQSIIDVVNKRGDEVLARLEAISTGSSNLDHTATFTALEIFEMRLKVARHIEAQNKTLTVETTQGARKVPIKKLVVPARLEEIQSKSETVMPHRDAHRDGSPPVPFMSFRRTFFNAVILGDPGGGKTTPNSTGASKTVGIIKLSQKVRANMLSRAHNFLFIHIPKTAGNSVQRALLGFSEDEMVLRGAHQDGVERFELRSPTLKIHKHSSLADYRAQLDSERFEGLFKFHGMRNPWDRCVSFFFSPHRGPVAWSPEAFETFIDTAVIPSHVFLQKGPNDPNPFGNADAVLRHEHLAADFEQVCARLGLGPLVLPRVNASERGDYRSYYRNDRLIARVAEKFAPEIKRFGYAFDPQAAA
jgi:hypothetical protein